MLNTGNFVPEALDLPTTVRERRVWEASFTFVGDGIGNPFDPADAVLSCELASPSGGAQTVCGFYYQGYQRSLVGGREVLTPVGMPQWRIRFAPRDIGEWRYRVLYSRQREDPSVLASGGFTVVADPDAPGFIGVDGDHFVDTALGAVYLPIGENLCWSESGGTYDFDRWIDDLAAQGGNYARLWVNEYPPSFGIEGRGTPLGNYIGRMDRAWALDHVLDVAERHGVRVVLCLLWHGAFSTKVNPDWSNNPYSAANGGPCARPVDFFTDRLAAEIFRRRLRYVVARWAASIAVLAWELWNEVNWVDGYDALAVRAWHEEMGGYLKSIDPAGHLVTTSYKDPEGNPAVWRLPAIDFVQAHDYNFLRVAERLTRLIADARGRYGKPMLFGEFGIDWRSARHQVERDSAGLHLHEGLWSAVFAGGAGTAMTWWWDGYVDRLGLYPIFHGFAAFATVARLGEMRPVAAEPLPLKDGLALWVMATADRARWAFWIKDLSASWQTMDARVVSGMRLPLESLVSGPARVRWFDTVRGQPPGPATVWNGASDVEVPTFTRDIACTILLLR